MANLWQKPRFRLLLYLEWVLLGVSLITAFGGLFPHPRHHWVSQPVWSSTLGIICIAALGIMGLRQPQNSKLIQGIYILSGFSLCWIATLLIKGGERVFAILLLVVLIRGCLLFTWRNRILVAVFAYLSFLAVQIMSLMRIRPLGIPLGRPFPPILRRLPPDELRRVLFGFAFNSSFLFAFVLAFVLLMVSAVLAESQSRTQLIVANRRLREYALKIENQATLEERNRIAREIHDSVGHYLTAQSIQLENTAVFLAKDQVKAANHLAKARQLGREALANIRASVAALRQNPVVEESLELGIEELIQEFQSNTSMAISSQVILLSTLPAEINTALYRIVQEALTNITKHSQATQVKLYLEQMPERIVLSIQDNGCGFNRNHNTTGFGLRGMEERTLALGGDFKIDSSLGQGCQIKVKIPLAKLY